MQDVSDSTFQKYAGSASCASCHKNIYDSFLTTGHFLTSQIAGEESIKGSFAKGKNVYAYNASLFMVMEKRNDNYFEVEYQNGKEQLASPFDIVIGSGTRGQTYLTWKNNSLFQLPVSYLSSINEWVNSPGASSNIILDRPVYARCMECHATYANKTSETLKGQETFDKKHIIYGVTCEKCHGPAANHVAYQTENPTVKTAKYIINPGTFSREQSLSLCRMCHGGRMIPSKPPFTFSAGDRLKDYFKINDSTTNYAPIDVHGNQYGLLSESKCFKNSATLTCLSCHNPHDKERGNVALFSQRCMTCHNKEHNTFCKISPTSIGSESTAFLAANCIDCHMPAEESKVIMMKTADSATMKAALLRSHLITVYPDATKKYLAIKFPGMVIK